MQWEQVRQKILRVGSSGVGGGGQNMILMYHYTQNDCRTELCYFELRSAPPHTGSPGPFGPGTLEKSEKSPERVPRNFELFCRKKGPLTGRLLASKGPTLTCLSYPLKTGSGCALLRAEQAKAGLPRIPPPNKSRKRQRGIGKQSIQNDGRQTFTITHKMSTKPNFIISNYFW